MRRSAMTLGVAAMFLGAACSRSSVEHRAPAPPVAPLLEELSSAPAEDTAAGDAGSPSPLWLALASSAAASPPDAALASVVVENIGMHIGGGPNDALTKAPIAASVAPHMDEFQACWSQAADPTRGGDFGIDLQVPAEGGRAAVSHPRTILKPDALRDCIASVFAGIDFQRPRYGRTIVSYSLRFTPPSSR